MFPLRELVVDLLFVCVWCVWFALNVGLMCFNWCCRFVVYCGLRLVLFVCGWLCGGVCWLGFLLCFLFS